MNSWGRGTADPLSRGFDISSVPDSGLGGTYTRRSDISPNAGLMPGTMRNPNFGNPVAGPGSPTDIRGVISAPGRAPGASYDRGVGTGPVDSRIGPGTGGLY